MSHGEPSDRHHGRHDDRDQPNLEHDVQSRPQRDDDEQNEENV